MSNTLDTDHDCFLLLLFFGPDLGLNCLQMLSVDKIQKSKANGFTVKK